MAKNTNGLLPAVFGPITFNRDTDNVPPLMLSQDIRGGLYTVADDTERDAIDGRMLSVNQIIYNTAAGRYERIASGTRNASGFLTGITWAEFSSGGSGPDTDTTYTIEWDTATRTLTLVGSDGSRDSEVLLGADDSDTTYTLEWDSDTRTLTLVSSDGVRDSEVISGGETYSALANNPLTLSGTTFSVAPDTISTTYLEGSGGALGTGTANQYLASDGAGAFVWRDISAVDSDTTYTFSTRASFRNPTRGNALVVTGGEYDSELLFQTGPIIELTDDNANNVFNRQLDIIGGSIGVSSMRGTALYTPLANGTSGQVLTSTGDGGFSWTNADDSDTTYTLSIHGTQIALRDNITGVIQSGSIVVDDSESGIDMLDSDHNSQGSLEFVIDSDSDIIYLQSSNYEPAHAGQAATNATDTVLAHGNSLTLNRLWGPTATGKPLVEPQGGATPPATTSWYFEVGTDFTDAYLNTLLANGTPWSVIVGTNNNGTLTYQRAQAAITNLQVWEGQVGNATWGGRRFIVIPNAQLAWNPSGVTTGSPTVVGGVFQGAVAQNAVLEDSTHSVIYYQVTNGRAAVPASAQVGLKLAVASTAYANAHGGTNTVFDSDTNGLVPAPGDSDSANHYLAGNGTWQTISTGAGSGDIQFDPNGLFSSLGEIGPVAGSNDTYQFNTPTIPGQAGVPIAQLSALAGTTGIVINTHDGGMFRHTSITDTDYIRITYSESEIRDFIDDSELQMVISSGATGTNGTVSDVTLLNDSELRVRTDNYAAAVPAGAYQSITLPGDTVLRGPTATGRSITDAGQWEFQPSAGGAANFVTEFNNAGVDDYEFTFIDSGTTYTATINQNNMTDYGNIEWGLDSEAITWTPSAPPSNSTFTTGVTARVRPAAIAQVGGTIDLASREETRRYTDSEIGSLRVHSTRENDQYRNSLVLETPNQPAHPGSPASFSMDVFGVSGSGTFTTSMQFYYLDSDGTLSPHTYAYSGNRSGVDAATGIATFLQGFPDDFTNVVRVNANVTWQMARPGYIYGYEGEPNTGSFGHQFHVISHGADSEAATYYDRILSTWTQEAPDDTEIRTLREAVTDLNRVTRTEVVGIPVEILVGPRDFRSIVYNNSRITITTLPSDSDVWTQLATAFTSSDTFKAGGGFPARFRIGVEVWDSDGAYDTFNSSQLQVNYNQDATVTFDAAADTLTIVLGSSANSEILEGLARVTRTDFTTLEDGYFTDLRLFDDTVYAHTIIDATDLDLLGEQNFNYSAIADNQVLVTATANNPDSDNILRFAPQASGGGSISFTNSTGGNEGNISDLRELSNNNVAVTAGGSQQATLAVQGYVDNSTLISRLDNESDKDLLRMGSTLENIAYSLSGSFYVKIFTRATVAGATRLTETNTYSGTVPTNATIVPNDLTADPTTTSITFNGQSITLQLNNLIIVNGVVRQVTAVTGNVPTFANATSIHRKQFIRNPSSGQLTDIDNTVNL